MDFSELLPIAHSIVERIWIIWGIHTTAVVAVIGWLIARRAREFDRFLQVVSTVLYSAFCIGICITFIKTYIDIELIINDLRHASAGLCYAHDGYIMKLLGFNFWKRIPIPIIVCSIVFVAIMFMIWSKKIGKLLIKATAQAKSGK